MIPMAFDNTRLGISTLTWKDQHPADGIRRAHALGLGAVDIGIIRDMTPVDVATLVDEPDRLLRPIEAALDETGIVVASFNARIKTDDIAAVRAQATALAAAAKRLKVQAGVTLGHGRVDEPLEDVVAQLQPRCEALVEAGVTPMVESHRRNFTEHIDQAASLLGAIDGLRLTLDASHWISQGLRVEAWEHLLPHVAHCHLRACTNEQLVAPTVACSPEVIASIRSLAQHGYTGYCTMEIIGDEDESIAFREYLIANQCFANMGENGV